MSRGRFTLHADEDDLTYLLRDAMCLEEFSD